jgi:hypothetical protein
MVMVVMLNDEGWTNDDRWWMVMMVDGDDE